MDITLPLKIAAYALSYLAGSIPTGVIVARAFGGVDPRTAGSKNIGATNVGRTLGKKAGLITLAGDFLKGFIPVIISLSIANDAAFTAAVGFSAFLGHIFPVFLGFKGGKGVATAAGVFAALSPAAVGVGAGVFAAALSSSGYVSAGSMLAAIAMIGAVYIFKHSLPYTLLAAMVAVIVVLKHSENIKRLLRGEENKLFKRK